MEQFFKQVAVINRALHYTMVPSINCKDSGRMADFMTLNGYAYIHPLQVFKPSRT